MGGPPSLCRMLSPALQLWLALVACAALTLCSALLQPQLVLGGSAQTASLGTATAVQTGTPQRTVPGAATTTTAATVRAASPQGSRDSRAIACGEGSWVVVCAHLMCRGTCGQLGAPKSCPFPELLAAERAAAA